jgi:hypothetical protein
VTGFGDCWAWAGSRMGRHIPRTATANTLFIPVGERFFMFSPAALTVIKVFAPKLWCLLFFGIFAVQL